MNTTIPIIDLIQRRRSWRSYGEAALEPEKKIQLRQVCNNLKTPFWGSRPRFDIVEVSPPGKGRMPGTYGMIKGAGVFMVGAIERNHRDMEDFGYVFEKIILYATDLDLATCWMGLTIDRGPLADKMRLLPNETIPAITPLGYPAKRRTLVDSITRASVGASKRKPWRALFFDGTWDTPLEKDVAGDYELPLEMVRLAPSSTNKQPWRIIRRNGAFHFFLQRSAGYYAKMTSAADLQRIDMGIAMCHFELAAKELALKGYWREIDACPVASLPKRAEYVVSWFKAE